MDRELKQQLQKQKTIKSVIEKGDSLKRDINDQKRV